MTNPEPFKPAPDPADCPDEATHTPEPWSIKYECALPWILGGVDDVVCNFDSQEYMMPLSDEDAKRILACVNACAGMADPGTEILQLHRLAIAPVAIEELQAELERETERQGNHDRELAERVLAVCVEACLKFVPLAYVDDLSEGMQDFDLDALLKGRLENQVLGRVARGHELPKDHQIGASVGGLAARRAHQVRVAVDVADDRVDLRQGDGEGFGHGDVDQPANEPRRCPGGGTLNI